MRRLERIAAAKLAVLEGMDRTQAAREYRVPYIVLAPHNFDLEAFKAAAYESGLPPERNTHSIRRTALTVG